MSSGFHRSRKGASVRLDADEAAVLHGLFGQLVELLGGGAEDHSGSDDPFRSLLAGMEPRERPDDPALARLLPDAYADDAEATNDFRRYTEGDLRQGKVDAATTAQRSLGNGGRVDLSEEQARAWLRALNDVRLTLGTRLEVTEDHERVFGALDDDDPRKALWYVYDWLSFLQQTLVEALMPE
ncbi:MAG: DUF2017 domain-containing protein [Streptosporangiales bacterium]